MVVNTSRNMDLIKFLNFNITLRGDRLCGTNSGYCLFFQMHNTIVPIIKTVPRFIQCMCKFSSFYND